MRISVWSSILTAALLVVVGCRTKAPQPGASSSSHGSLSPKTPTPESPVVTAANPLIGKIARVNMIGRFVVITFPIGHLPDLGQPLNVYRDGLKVGEVRVTGPQLDDSLVADLIAGEAQPGDEVRR